MDFETLAWGYGLVEGPCVDDAGNLFFSDVVRGGVYRRCPEGSVETVVPRRRGVGGIALHAEGGLVVSGRNVCHVRDGVTRLLFEQPDVGGFNDLFADSAGRVYVGSLRSNPFAAGERVPGELWRIDAEGRAEVVYGGVGLSNGIGFAPDARHLYHADSHARRIWVYDVETRERRVFASVEVGAPDGLAVDQAGGVWVASFGGGCVLRYAPDGSLDRRIAVPADSVTSVCFGGADRRDLYVVSADNRADPDRHGSIFRARCDLAGLAVPPARV